MNSGKLSYTYWRGFERYDQAWGLSAKYTETVAKLSKEALELDRQYKIRQKTLRYSFLSYHTVIIMHIAFVRHRNTTNTVQAVVIIHVHGSAVWAQDTCRLAHFFVQGLWWPRRV